MVYDVTSKTSFKSVQKWIDDVKNQRGENVIIAVLGNKIDVDDREVSTTEGQTLAEDNQVMFKEVSAKSGVNIQEFFKEVASQLPEVNGANNGESASRTKIDSSTDERPNIVL